MAHDQPPVARVREGRVELSLNSTNTAIAAGVLLLTLFLAYELGHGFRSSATPGATAAKLTDDLSEVRDKTPDAGVLDVGPVAPPAGRTNSRSATAGPSAVPGGSAPKVKTNPPAPPSPSPPNNPPTPAVPAGAGVAERTGGLTHVVLEGFKYEDKAEAEQIQQWLKNTQNIDTTVERGRGERWELVSTQGYDYNKDPDRQKCDEFRSIVKELGRKYKQEFGAKANYLMREPGLRKKK